MSPSKYWKLSNHSMGEELTIEKFKVISQFGKKTDCLGVKEESYWDLVEVYNFICPILYNQINLGYNVFHNLLEYGNEYIKKLSVDEDKVHNYLLLIDSSINEKINLREEFDVSDEWKELNSLENIRSNNQTPITNMLDIILNRDLRIDELNKKERYLIMMFLK